MIDYMLPSNLRRCSRNERYVYGFVHNSMRKLQVQRRNLSTRALAIEEDQAPLSYAPRAQPGPLKRIRPHCPMHKALSLGH